MQIHTTYYAREYVILNSIELNQLSSVHDVGAAV